MLLGAAIGINACILVGVCTLRFIELRVIHRTVLSDLRVNSKEVLFFLEFLCLGVFYSNHIFPRLGLSLCFETPVSSGLQAASLVLP